MFVMMPATASLADRSRPVRPSLCVLSAAEVGIEQHAHSCEVRPIDRMVSREDPLVVGV